MADAAGSSDPEKDLKKPDRKLTTSKVEISDSQTPGCLCLSTKLQKIGKFNLSQLF